MKIKDILDQKVVSGIKSLEKKNFLKKIGRTAKDAIRLRTRLGYGVDEPGGKKTKLAKLDPGYKKQRKKLSKNGDLSSQTTPSKSNLTKTGEMLDTVHFKVTGKSIEVRVKPDQVEKVKGNVDLGRTFFNLSDLEQKQLLDMIKKRLRDFARK